MSKSILKVVAVFALLLFVFGMLLSSVFIWLSEGKTHEEYYTFLSIQIWTWDLITVGLLFLAAKRISVKLTKPSYWKIALATLGIMVLHYHLCYVYELMDYYIIKGPPMEQKGSELEKVLALFNGNSRLTPTYDPIFQFFHVFTDLQYRELRRQYLFVFLSFLFGNLTMPLWISAVVFFIQRKKIGNKNSLIDQ
jgi:uncharacterized membrane protein